MRTSAVAPYTAHLRIYEPLGAFPDGERDRWERYVRTYAQDPASAPSAAVLTAEERHRALVNLLATPPAVAPPHEADEAYVRFLDGVALVCPRQTRLRCWHALTHVRREYPAAVVDAFWPRVVVEQAQADHERWRARHPEARTHIRGSTWHVPVRWFALFTEDERVDVPAGGASGGGAELYYRTPMVQARRRVARALRALRDTMEDGALVTGLEDVGRWLEEFHPRALVELDYGALAGLVDGEGAAGRGDGTSVADVADGIAALGAGDGARASAAYQRITERWHKVRALEHAS